MDAAPTGSARPPNRGRGPGQTNRGRPPDHTRLLTPLGAMGRSGRARRALAADVETAGLNGPFVLGCIYDPARNGGRPEFFTDPEPMLDYFLTHRYRGCELLFHNADYDLRYFLPRFQQLSEAGGASVDLHTNGRGAIIYARIRIGRHSWYIRDTYALIPLPLRDLAPLAGLPKLDIGLASGVCFDPDLAEHRAYLTRDAVMLYQAFRAYSNRLHDAFTIRPGITAGATAMLGWRRTIPAASVYFRQRPEVDEAARRAYYGGAIIWRSAATHDDVIKVDRNAAFASAMRAGVPMGSASACSREYPDQAGIYLCRVAAPPNIPVAWVPYRSGGIVTTPAGVFSGWLPSNIIGAARGMGYTVEVDHGFVFRSVDPVFTEFVDRCEHIERGMREAGAALVVKTLRNSLYGKFGQAPNRIEYMIGPRPPGSDWTPVCLLDGTIVDYLHFRRVEHWAAHMRPEWAAWISAEARVDLLRTAYAVGIDNVIYGDTDSLVVRRPALEHAIMIGAIDMGSGYGQFKTEAQYTQFQAIAPKLYWGRRADNGQVEAVHKAIPAGALDPEVLTSMRAGLSVSFDSVPRALVSWQRAGAGPDRLTRTIGPPASGVRWLVNAATGRVYPQVLKGDPDAF